MEREFLTEDWVHVEIDKNRTREKFDRFSLLSREAILKLSKIDSIRVIEILFLDFLIIFFAAVVSEHYWSPLLYALVTMVIGARQIGIGSIGLHDGAHGMLFRNRKLNDFVAIFLTEPLFVGLLDMHLNIYRRTHFEHHRHTNDHKDPDSAIYENWYKKSPRSRLLWLLIQITGLYFLFLIAAKLRRGNLVSRTVVVFILSTIAFGLAYSIYPIQLVLIYWIVPFATWGMFIHTLQTVAEHFPVEFESNNDVAVDHILRTRDTRLSWFDSLFVATRGVNFHFTHHLFPSVPFFRLGQLHRLISVSDQYQQRAHVNLGYHEVLREVLDGHDSPRR